MAGRSILPGKLAPHERNLAFFPAGALREGLRWRTRMRSLEERVLGQRIRKGDLVQVVAGADKGKQGRVLGVDTERGRVRVEKVRMQKRHLKPGRRGARTGGIVEQEGMIDASNVMLLDAGSGQPSRVRVKQDGDRRLRVFAKSGDNVPDPAQA